MSYQPAKNFETIDEKILGIRLPAGYQMRPFRLEDGKATVELLNASSRALLGVDQYSLERMLSEWQTPGFNLATDTCVVVSPDGQIVGYADVWDLQAPYVHKYSDGCVHPDHLNRGIGKVLLEWIEERGRQGIAKAPEGARVILLQGQPAVNRAAYNLFIRQGYRLVRNYRQMRIDLKEPPLAPVLPERVVIRSMIAGQEERPIMRAMQEAFRDHWGFVEEPFEAFYERWMHYIRNDSEFDPTLWFVACDGSEIAGMSLCQPSTPEDRQMGWINTLCVRRPWRKRGLGLALLQHTFGEFYWRGIRKVGLGVDSSNLTGATRLYERAGMRIVREYNSYEKELRPGLELSTQQIDPQVR